VWGENIYIDVEPNINFCIRQVRGVLLDEAAHRRYIETVPREGYRFLAALASSVSEADLPTDQTDLIEAPADLNKTPIEVASVKPGISRWLMVAIALAALMIVGVVLWLRTPAQTAGVTRILPVTTYPGDEREPSLSPDGHQVAFSWDGGELAHLYQAAWRIEFRASYFDRRPTTRFPFGRRMVSILHLSEIEPQ
jgi:hypothetical protein